jgi:hypothetical protein
MASRVHEALDLTRVLSVAAADTKHDAIVLGQLSRSDNWIVCFWGSAHFDQDFIGECLGDKIDVARGASRLDAFGDGLRKLCDMPVLS